MNKTQQQFHALAMNQNEIKQSSLYCDTKTMSNLVHTGRSNRKMRPQCNEKIHSLYDTSDYSINNPHSFTNATQCNSSHNKSKGCFSIFSKSKSLENMQQPSRVECDAEEQESLHSILTEHSAPAVIITVQHTTTPLVIPISQTTTNCFEGQACAIERKGKNRFYACAKRARQLLSLKYSSMSNFSSTPCSK